MGNLRNRIDKLDSGLRANDQRFDMQAALEQCRHLSDGAVLKQYVAVVMLPTGQVTADEAAAVAAMSDDEAQDWNRRRTEEETRRYWRHDP